MSNQSSGRPPESGNRQYVNAVFGPSRCPRCGSTQRVPYFGRLPEQAFEGYTGDGEPYTHIVRRRTKCCGCGQFRVDISYENRPGKHDRPRKAKPKRRKQANRGRLVVGGHQPETSGEPEAQKPPTGGSSVQPPPAVGISISHEIVQSGELDTLNGEAKTSSDVVGVGH